MNDFPQKLPEFIHNHWALCLLFVILLVGLIVTQLMHMLRKDKSLTPAQLTQLINRENALVIDISPLGDYEKAHIPGAKHVAMSQFDPENKELAKVKDMPVVVVCKTGQTAAKATQRLVKAGFQRVYRLNNGMMSWKQADLPVSKGRN
ncbi:rhodanese-like domain-containing protein [Oleiagrimonas sp. C23AA]|uniref:rhodanese-like domain-containing protein n=1 Tax=Oleiagrimonas sp. C23AA TaxID=2719047 RepID=UPI001420EE03|nr:rhodanese-like domain-containing protein [Oleiagrimonas sp. C23AA]NII12326.1 rhodanese-like domain-containing protein [Oleiagrimonas sp. C23AA]